MPGGAAQRNLELRGEIWAGDTTWAPPGTDVDGEETGVDGIDQGRVGDGSGGFQCKANAEKAQSERILDGNKGKQSLAVQELHRPQEA